jgi:hypothetical protein
MIWPRHHPSGEAFLIEFKKVTLKSQFHGALDSFILKMMTINSSNLPDALGFAAPGVSHQGVFDCRCIAEALRIARRQGRF